MRRSSIKAVASDDIGVRRGGAADRDPILELLRVSLGEGRIPRSLDYWMWKHERNPFGPSPILVAEAGGRIVGLRVFMRWTWVRDRENVRAVRAVDTATHPDWRGRGVFSRLTLELVEEMRSEGVALVFNTPNQLSRPGYLKLGWSSVGRVSLWVRPRRPLRMLRVLGRAGRKWKDRPADDAPGTNGLSGLRPAAELVEEPGLDDCLKERPPEEDRLRTDVTRDYLRWRYAEIPSFAYGANWTFRDGYRAAIVARIRSNEGLRELRLCEVLAGSSRRSVLIAADLIRRMMGETRADYAAAMAVFGTPEQRALVRAGFVPAPRLGPILTVRPLSDNPGFDPLRRSAWRLSIGDLELF